MVLPLNLLVKKPGIKRGIKIPYSDKKRMDISSLEKAFLSYKGFNNLFKKSVSPEINVTLSKAKK